MGGFALVLAGAWLITQVVAGDALARLGVAGELAADEYNVDPKSGVPNQNPHLPLLRDPNGRPY